MKIRLFYSLLGFDDDGWMRDWLSRNIPCKTVESQTHMRGGEACRLLSQASEWQDCE